MAESTGTGKWATADVPHKGWACVFVDDLGSQDAVCEMCEAREIRYVHFMEHPEYDRVLAVGHLCAGHMSEDYEGADRRDKVARQISARRAAWKNRLWRTSNKGNPYINTSDGYNVTVYQVKSGDWGYSITHRPSEKRLESVRFFPTEQEAKRESLAGIVWAKHLDELETAEVFRQQREARR